ncbi:DUF4174 domain-containing protein [Winogradskyella sp.]|uniref:DUF4174 domain-containing protein n=1 Tax=Winogradskyella sp. TaxID=1883156 RepID=UPI003BAD085A
MKYQLLFLLLSLCISVKAQDLEKHQWKHRILLIISEDETSGLVKLQLELLDEPAPLNERKLIIYRLHPKQYRIIGSNNTDWIMDSTSYDKYNSEGHEFKTVLIGLDGGVKLEAHDVLDSEKLFFTIDRMPMRQRELRDH